MLLNHVEKVLVNNPVRDRMLRGTVRRLHQLAGAPPIARALEIGCGEGAAAAAIMSTVHPESFDAFDLDPAQVERARQRLSAQGVAMNRLWVGDAEHIDAADQSYDVVFEFTILHHVPNWRQALVEIARVLKPGGHFLFEDLAREFFHDTGPLGWALRRYTEHPWNHMFDWDSFVEGMTAAGLELVCHRPQLIKGWHQGIAVRA